jgi:hypothetical protein
MIRRYMVAVVTAVAMLIAVTAMPAAPASASQHSDNGALDIGDVVPEHAPFALVRPYGLAGIRAQQGSDSGGNELCLANAPSYCAAFSVENAADTILSVASVVISIWGLILTKKGDGGQEEEVEDQGEANGGDTDEGLCLQSTGGDVKYESCSSASGAVWIQVPHGDGFYLEDRYLYDHGQTAVLTVSSPSGGDALYLAAPGDGGWQTWEWNLGG